MEVGSDLPPLKNEIIQEKRRELEQYQELKRMKAQAREEKRLNKIREKEVRELKRSAADLDDMI